MIGRGFSVRIIASSVLEAGLTTCRSAANGDENLGEIGHSPLADEYRRMVNAIGDAVHFMETLSGEEVHNLNRVDFKKTHVKDLFGVNVFNEEVQRQRLPKLLADLSGAGVELVGAELAALADACLEAALRVAAREAGVEHAGLAVLGMGKLGGGELNYVSDLDVLFCHRPPDGAEPDAAARTAERVVRELLSGLGQVTPEGTCFRVDANLRPEGRNGPLSRTLGSYQAYWDRWAQPWELQALVKVRPVAGDGALAGRFCAEAAARVYPERLDPETVAAIRHGKARVEAERLPAGADPRTISGAGARSFAPDRPPEGASR